MEWLTYEGAYWWWIIVGVALLMLEVMTMSLFLLWPGVAAGVVGAISFFAPGLTLAMQLALFAVISAVLTFIGRGVFTRTPLNAPSDRPTLNRRGAQMVGRRVTAIHTFNNGEGSVRVDDGQWTARFSGPVDDIVDAGDPLIVAAVEGSALIVKRPE